MQDNEENIIQGDDFIKGMMKGMGKIATVIRPTYGGAGTNVIVQSNLSPGHLLTNDAQTIVQALKFTGVAQKRMLAIIQELCNRADKMSGDARKTTILLAEEIIKAGYDLKSDKNILKKELDALIPFIESAIDAQTTQITPDEVGKVATTSSESAETGAILQEIYQKIGKDGIIHPEGSGTYETYYKFIDGVRFHDTGYLSSSMVYDEQAIKDKVKPTKAVYENPLILVTKKKIVNDDDINPLLWQMRQEGHKDLVIFTQDMDSNVASMLVDLHKKGDYHILIIKAPTLWRDFVFEDFAKCTGSTIIEDATGKTFKNMNMEDLGTCGKIIVDQDETIVIGTKDISEHIENLKEKGDDDSKLRLSWLTSKSAILRLGANSETDLSYKRLKCNDAVCSSQAALQYGIVRGGGLCLDSVADLLPDTEAGFILKQALKAPLAQNMANGCTLIPENIVDASKVVKNAVRNAVGIASTVLTASSYVYIPELTQEEMAYKVATQQNNAFA